MSKAVSQSAAVNALKAKSKGAWSESQKVEAKPKGFAQLPGGIVGGIARIVGAVFKMSDDKGKGIYPTIQLKLMVREPIEFEGSMQMLFYNFKDGKPGKFQKTVKDRLDEWSSDAQLLGIDVEKYSEDDFPAMMEKLTKDKPYFIFNTNRSKGTAEYEAQTYINIQRQCTAEEVNSLPELGVTVDEGTEPVDEGTEPVEEVQTPAPAAKPKGPKAPKAPPAKAAVVEDVEAVEEVTEVVEAETQEWVPAVTDRFYLNVKGERWTVAVVEVLEDEQKVVVENEETHAKVKVSWQKCRDDNAE